DGSDAPKSWWVPLSSCALTPRPTSPVRPFPLTADTWRYSRDIDSRSLVSRLLFPIAESRKSLSSISVNSKIAKRDQSLTIRGIRQRIEGLQGQIGLAARGLARVGQGVG